MSYSLAVYNLCSNWHQNTYHTHTCAITDENERVVIKNVIYKGNKQEQQRIAVRPRNVQHQCHQYILIMSLC